MCSSKRSRRALASGCAGSKRCAATSCCQMRRKGLVLQRGHNIAAQYDSIVSNTARICDKTISQACCATDTASSDATAAYCHCAHAENEPAPRQPLNPRPGRRNSEAGAHSEPDSVELVAQIRTRLGVSGSTTKSARRQGGRVGCRVAAAALGGKESYWRPSFRQRAGTAGPDPPG